MPRSQETAYEGGLPQLGLRLYRSGIDHLWISEQDVPAVTGVASQELGHESSVCGWTVIADSTSGPGTRQDPVRPLPLVERKIPLLAKPNSSAIDLGPTDIPPCSSSCSQEPPRRYQELPPPEVANAKSKLVERGREVGIELAKVGHGDDLLDWMDDHYGVSASASHRKVRSTTLPKLQSF